jgi:hypothetical protein
MAFAFEKLLIQQKAVDFPDHICQLSGTSPRGFYFLADQINRAALSISTNIAEGNGRFTKPNQEISLASRADRFRNGSRCWKWPGGAGSFRKPSTTR